MYQEHFNSRPLLNLNDNIITDLVSRLSYQKQQVIRKLSPRFQELVDEQRSVSMTSFSASIMFSKYQKRDKYQILSSTLEQQIRPLVNLIHLDLSSFQMLTCDTFEATFDTRLLQVIKDLPFLEFLDISNQPIRDGRLSELLENSKIKILKLDGCKNLTDDGIRESMEVLDTLSEISFLDTKVTSNIFNKLELSSSVSRMAAQINSGHGHSYPLLKSEILTSIVSKVQLQVLVLQIRPYGLPMDWSKIVQLVNLKSLSIICPTYCLSNSDLTVISSSINVNLISFNMKFNDDNYRASYVTYEGIRTLELRLRNLKNFGLECGHHWFDTCCAKYTLRTIRTLESLNLCCSWSFNDESILQILTNNPDMATLDVSNCAVSNALFHEFMARAKDQSDKNFTLILAPKERSKFEQLEPFPKNLDIVYKTKCCSFCCLSVC